ncbi:amidohydrolase [Thermocrinis albus DSM 14484]|uniref:5-methylthioadenosine/S-adenosylhomocysteine deaminase n=1 Tax=Thermocrinis albus (strain DSM 14484 / JCM 11386 / HI 11/12) TaxID=638303 RepID=D3SMA5_THEAH|nr:amidohydrolase [Thermocrinis albus]ADC89885.1 amidohydrolase [Thermocrinis albus DSM 14484]
MLDLLIKGAYIPQKGKVLDVGVKDGVIIRVEEGIEEEARYTIKAEGKLLFPSFANMHTHISMSLLRGIGADLPLMDWLQKVIWPLESEFVSPQFVRDGALLGIAEAIKSGTTLLMDMYFFEEEIAKVAKEVGIRVGLGFGILDFPTKVAKTQEEYLARAREFARNLKGEDLVFPVLCPHAPYTCGPDTLRKVKALADEEGLYIHIHVSETLHEFQSIKEQYGKTPVAYLDHLGLLAPNLLMAHVVWTEPFERDLIAHRGAKVLHCPESNLKLGSGIAPVSDYLKRGVHVCLGTDGPASNDNLDMLEEMSTMVKLQKGVTGDPGAIDAPTALKVATQMGFQAVNIKAGLIEPGYEADLILVDTSGLHLQPLYDPIAQLVYSAKSSDIDTVVCKGRVLMEKRELKTIDEEEVKFVAKRWKEKILQKIRN